MDPNEYDDNDTGVYVEYTADVSPTSNTTTVNHHEDLAQGARRPKPNNPYVKRKDDYLRRVIDFKEAVMRQDTYTIPAGAPRVSVPSSFDLSARRQAYLTSSPSQANTDNNRNSNNYYQATAPEGEALLSQGTSSTSPLTLKQCILIDLLAVAVSQGGATLEEEIAAREEMNDTYLKYNPTPDPQTMGNPCFSFLREPWDTPAMLYYRWRLYSLLQGDNLLKWREEEYQIERGVDSVVWRPPASEVYYNAFDEPSRRQCYVCQLQFVPPALYLSKMTQYYKNSHHHWKGMAPGVSVTFEVLFSPTAEYFARVESFQKTLFACLDESDEEEWKYLLQSILDPTPYNSEKKETEKIKTGLKLDHLTLEQLTTVKNNLIQHHLGDSDSIAQRMLFVLEHPHYAYHCYSLLLDQIFEIAAILYNLSLESETLSSEVNVYRQNDLLLKIQIYNSCLLFYLFVLNDILYNIGTKEVTEEELQLRYDSGGNLQQTSSSQNNTASHHMTLLLANSLPTVLPLLVEGIFFSVLVSFTILNTVANKKIFVLEGSNNNNNNNNEFGVSTSLTGDATATIDLSSVLPTNHNNNQNEKLESLFSTEKDSLLQQTCVTTFVTFQWLRSVLAHWLEGQTNVNTTTKLSPFIPLRLWSVLQEKYGFLLPS